jgi:uncharacterized protein YfkK (UPF0435 family)
MSRVDIFPVFKEFSSILLLLENKSFDYTETIDIIAIRISQDLNLELIKSFKDKINYFNLSCNPFNEDIEDIIYDLENNMKEISEITDISINLEKNITFDKYDKIDYLFFDKKSAISSLCNITEKRLNKLNIGIINNENVETEIINFISLENENSFGDVAVHKIHEQIIENLDFYLSNNKRSKQNYNYNPYSFILKNNQESTNEFVKMLENEFYKTFLDCLAEKEDINGYVIRGEINISISNTNEFSTKHYQDFLNIFSFLISQRRYTEKYMIIKRVITLYLVDKDSISKLDESLPNIWKTISHYYNHYIEDDIKDFFKTKDQLLKEAMSASKVIFEQTDKISNSFIGSILSVLILLVTTLFRTLDNITLIYAVTFIIIFIVFSIIFYMLMKSSSIKRYDLISKQFNLFIDEISLIPTDEVTKIRKIYLEDPYSELLISINKLRMLFVGINIGLLITVFIFKIAEIIKEIIDFVLFIKFISHLL